MTSRWSEADVLAAAPSASVASSGRQLAHLDRWSSIGCDHEALWGRCHGSGSEPYSVAVDHVTRRFRCSCPARTVPCKHAVALALLWANDLLPVAARPRSVEQLVVSRPRTTPAPEDPQVATTAPPTVPSVNNERAAERAARVAAGLRDLDRWIIDRLRRGIGAPELERREPWDQLATRLTDSQCGALANRVRRLAHRVEQRTASPAIVAAELGLWHLIARGAAVDALPDALNTSVRTAVGWPMSTATLRATPGVRDRWWMAGQSVIAEERITVRRSWLWGVESKRWAVVIDAAAYGSGFDSLWPVGRTLDAELHVADAAAPLRALVGIHHAEPDAAGPPAACADTLAVAMDRAGRLLAGEPWLERVPIAASVQLARTASGWVATDASGSLPIDPAARIAPAVAAGEGEPVLLVAEFVEGRLSPIAVHVDHRVVAW
jgi:hypothetical protein